MDVINSGEFPTQVAKIRTAKRNDSICFVNEVIIIIIIIILL